MQRHRRQAAAPAAVASQPAAPVAQIASLETRVVESEQKIASLEARNSDSSRSPFTSRFSIRGYLQTRYTSMLGGDEGVNLWSDRSVGDDQSLPVSLPTAAASAMVTRRHLPYFVPGVLLMFGPRLAP